MSMSNTEKNRQGYSRATPAASSLRRRKKADWMGLKTRSGLQGVTGTGYQARFADWSWKWRWTGPI